MVCQIRVFYFREGQYGRIGTRSNSRADVYGLAHLRRHWPSGKSPRANTAVNQYGPLAYHSRVITYKYKSVIIWRHTLLNANLHSLHIIGVFA